MRISAGNLQLTSIPCYRVWQRYTMCSLYSISCYLILNTEKERKHMVHSLPMGSKYIITIFFCISYWKQNSVRTLFCYLALQYVPGTSNKNITRVEEWSQFILF